jgi:predicted NACHT family NTPase
MGAVDTVITELLKRVFESYDRRHAQKPPPQRSFEEALSKHLRTVAAWSEHVEMFGFATARETDVATIDLFMSVPRKFAGGRGAQLLDELQLLAPARHYILLGDPGGGKTTTLKRLSRHLITTGSTSNDPYQYPVVVRLRELTHERLLEEALADALAIPHNRIFTADLKLPSAPRITISEFSVINFGGAPFIVETNGEPLPPTIAEVLAQTSGVLLLDGLDEMASDIRRATEQAIADLAIQFSGGKIIVSCRSGDYTAKLPGFDTLEIKPLTQEQIVDIATRWCAQPDEFLMRLRELPFADLASRPLFLCQLILLYHTVGFLPSDPSAVYRRIVRLALEEWDRQRGIARETRYARFDPDRKVKFLAHLAFRLTYASKTKRFSTSELVGVYREICDNFGLPAEDAIAVVRELETHTGIFVESALDRYEFSHLSLQEYLCAEYLVGASPSSKLGAYLAHDPAPFAVAVGISTHPSRWFANLFLRAAVTRVLGGIKLEGLFSRLEHEAPELGVDNLLGFAALGILFAVKDPGPYTERFLARPAVASSIASILPLYAASQRDEVYHLSLVDSPWEAARDIDPPVEGILTGKRLNEICGGEPVKFKTLS